MALIVFAFFALKEHYFQTIDDFFYTPMFSKLVDSTNPSGFKNVNLISIDSKFFTNEWVTVSTFHRWYYAKLNEKLKDYGVSNIVYDVFFQDLKYGSGDNIAQKLYRKSVEYFDKKFFKSIDDRFVFGVLPKGKNGIELPAKKILENNSWLWYVKSHINKNKINDGTYPYVSFSWDKILTLWFSAYFNRLYTQKKIDRKLDISVDIKKWLLKYFTNDYLIIKTNKKTYKIPLSKDKDGSRYYFTPLFLNKKIKTYSIYDIIHDDDNLYKDKFEWRTVFVWATDTALNDIKMSYIGFIPWVMFHINNFLSIYSNHYFYILPIWQTFLIFIILFFIGYIFVVLFKNEKLTFAVFFVLMFSLFVWYYAAFISGVIIPIGTIIIIMFIKLVIDIIHILFINQEKRKFLSSLFDKYVGSKIREEKEKETKTSNKFIITTKKKNIALMFSDIASFTNISEKLKAEEVGKMLNIYFEVCWDYLVKSWAYVDKYIWDAIMAYWEDLEYLDWVVEAVVNIQKSHPEIISRIKDNLWKTIDIVTRIGLHYWEAIVWDIWDINNKIQPTAIWDNVNLASRLEGINKYYNTRVIISEDFYEKIKDKKKFAIRMLDKITVKWKTEPVTIYEVMLYFWDEINEKLKEYIKNFEVALQEYFTWNFELALNLFKNLANLKFWQSDKVVKVFIERLEYLLKHKPDNWDGVWRYSTK